MIANLLAIILGPLLAVIVGEYLQDRKEKKERKKTIFTSLMATRGMNLHPDRIRALNMIDVVFISSNRKEKEVRDKWKSLYNHFNIEPSEDENAIWSNTTTKKYNELIGVMASCLGYSITTSEIEAFSYLPKQYHANDMAIIKLREKSLEILEGKSPLPVSVVDTANSGESSR